MKRATHFFCLALLAAGLGGSGCVSSRLIEDTRVPEITVDSFGAITFGNERVELAKLSKAVRSAGIKRDQEVNILIPENFDRMLRNRIYSEMLRGGYSRTIFITDRKATSAITGKTP